MSVNNNRNRARTMITCVLAFLFFVTPAFAQEWQKYKNQADGFEMEIPPGLQVKVTQGTYKTWTEFTLPQRVYSAERGAEHYSVTVADYRGIQALGRTKLAKCQANDEICTGTPLSGEGYWKHDLRGAMLYAASNLLKRDAKFRDMAWDQISRISTIQISLTNNKDESQTYALVTMNKRMLYIVEATVPKGAVSPIRFGGSFSVVSRTDGSGGNGFAYPSLYSNEIYGIEDIPAPPPAKGAEGGARPFKPDEFKDVPLPTYQ